jgi:uncharacterized protein YndB with AHSA1/START domain
MPSSPSNPPSLDVQITINATPDRVLESFFDPHAIASWWQAERSVTVNRPLGVYAVQWAPAPVVDDVLGALGGTFYGIVMDYRENEGFFVAEAYWLPPTGEPLGPMAFDVALSHVAGATTLRVKQTGFEESPRWRRYYQIINDGWAASLEALKAYSEQDLADRLWGKWGRLTAEERAKAAEEQAALEAAASLKSGAVLEPPAPKV